MSTGGIKLWANEDQAHGMPNTSMQQSSTRTVRQMTTVRREVTTQQEVEVEEEEEEESEEETEEESEEESEEEPQKMTRQEFLRRQQIEQQKKQQVLVEQKKKEDEQRRQEIEQRKQQRMEEQRQEKIEQQQRQQEQKKEQQLEQQRRKQQEEQKRQDKIQKQQEEQKCRQQEEEQRRQQGEQQKRQLQEQQRRQQEEQAAEQARRPQEHLPQRKIWGQPQTSPQRVRPDFVESEPERLRKQQQQEHYRKNKEDQERLRMQKKQGLSEEQPEGGMVPGRGMMNNMTPASSTIELKQAPAPLDSDVWPPKSSNLQPLPKTGFYPTEVRNEQERGPKSFVWPPTENDEFENSIPAAARGGVARSYIPPSGAAVNAWNPPSPGSTKKLPEWSQYKPQRTLADDIWPPREVCSTDESMPLEKPEPRKAHRLEYIKRGQNVPVTYHTPPGSQNTSIEGRYSYAT